MTVLIDQIVLGHNPFFGVDHLSRERGAQREATFEDTSAIMEMIQYAVDHGARGLMMSTHPRAMAVCEQLRGDTTLGEKVRLYPLLPYIAKYVRQSNEKGILNTILDQMKGASLGRKLGLLSGGGFAMIRKDFLAMLRTLIRVELNPFRDLNLQAVFLHDVLADLAVAFDMPAIFELYAEEVAKRFDSTAAFATKNLPLFNGRTAGYGIDPLVVLTHVNKIGFGMNPSQAACEQCLRENSIEAMAMGTLASGYLQPEEAYEYVCSQPHVDSVVVGVSTPAHAEETFAAIRKHATAGK